MPISVPIMPNAGAQSPMALAALVQMHQEVVAVALEIVADEFEIVAVGDVTNALGEERFVGLDLFQSHRALLAGDFGDAGEFVDQVAGRQPAHGEGELRAERQPVQHHAKRKPDHGGGDRAAEDDDHRMFRDEHVNIAAQQHHRCDDDDAGEQPDASHDIHQRLQRARAPPSMLDGARPVRNRAFRTYVGSL
jgi:hypothetical protein